MAQAVRVIDRVAELADWDQSSFADGQVARWDEAAGKFVGVGLADSTRVEVPFAWGDATPVTLTTVAAGKLVERVTLYVTAAFDGVGASLAVGDAGDAGRLLPASENDPAQAAAYESSPGHSYGATTPITLTITPGLGASQGAGLAVLEIQN